MRVRPRAQMRCWPGCPRAIPRLRYCARAYTAQHRHQFDAAAGLLDRVIHDQPRDAEARLSRAHILLVQGHLDRARHDCTVLAFGVDASSGQLCTAALALRSGDHGAAARLLDRWLAQRQQWYPHVVLPAASVAIAGLAAWWLWERLEG